MFIGFSKNKAKKQIFNENLQPNDDEFSWSELNCFYKPFSIALKSFDYRYFDSFLLFLSFFISFGENNSGRILFNKQDSMFEYFNCELENIFNIKINCMEFGSKKAMNTKIEDALMKKKVIIVPTDLIYLPYSENYMEKHHNHYILIKGFDSRKKIYYILDNMHMNLGSDAIYSDFMMEYRLLYSMTTGFKKAYDPMSYSSYFWTIESKDDNIDFSVKCLNYCRKVCKNIISGKTKIKYFELEILSEISSNNFSRNLIGYLESVNTRSMYYNLIKKYINKFDCVDISKVDSIKEKADEINEKWLKIKYYILLKYAKNSSNINNVKVLIDEVISLNLIFIKEVSSFINKYNLLIGQNYPHLYIIINRKDAELKIDKNIYMNINNLSIYDLWVNKDDACQVLFKTDYNEVSLETKISVVTEKAESESQCGIIIKTKSGDKLLAGICGMVNFEIHTPNMGSKYLMYKKTFEFGESFSIKVECTKDNNYRIYRKEDEKLRIIFETKLSEEVEYIGVFAKSWERCNCSVNFENILLNGKHVL